MPRRACFRLHSAISSPPWQQEAWGYGFARELVSVGRHTQVRFVQLPTYRDMIHRHERRAATNAGRVGVPTIKEASLERSACLSRYEKTFSDHDMSSRYGMIS